MHTRKAELGARSFVKTHVDFYTPEMTLAQCGWNRKPDSESTFLASFSNSACAFGGSWRKPAVASSITGVERWWLGGMLALAHFNRGPSASFCNPVWKKA